MITFAYPMFLWGLAVLSVPFLLHLLNRHHPKRLVFPVIRFLYRTQLPEDGRRRLQDLLLLLARMAILAFAVLLMARPTWVPQAAPKISAGRKCAVILMDCSASMSGWGHMDRAQELVAQAVGTLEGWDVGVVMSSSKVGAILEPTENLKSVMDFIGNAQVTCLCGEHSSGLQQAVQMLGDASEKRLIFVSDFRRNDWSAVSKAVPDNIPVEFLDCGKDGEENVGIISVRSSLLPNKRRRIIATLRNYSPKESVRKVSVKLGSGQQEQTVTMQPHAQLRVAFALENDSEATSGDVLLEHDEYALDDSYVFSLKELPLPKALVITNSDEEQKKQLAAHFTCQALASDGALQELSTGGFDVTVSSPMDLLIEQLRDVRIVFALGGLEKYPEDVFKGILSLVEEGGVLFVTPGEGGVALTLRRLQENGLMSVQANGVAEASAKANMGMGKVEEDSPIGKLLADWSETDAFLFPIFRHLRFKAMPPARVLIHSLAGHPLLVEKSCGLGRCYLFAFDFGLEWSSFPLTSSFLPILRELSSMGIPDGYGVRRLVCGEKYATDEGDVLDTSKPAFFQAGGFPVEIRVSEQEAIDDRINTEDLRLMVCGGASQPLAASGNVAKNDVELWRLCACLLAFFCVAESALRRFV